MGLLSTKSTPSCLIFDHLITHRFVENHWVCNHRVCNHRVCKSPGLYITLNVREYLKILI